MSRVDSAAVRATQDVDVMVSRAHFSAARAALEAAGFVHRHVTEMDVFLDSPSAKPRDAVHIVFACERVRPTEPLPNPELGESVDEGEFRVLSLDALVRIKLTAFRDKDRTHLRDLIDVGLVDADWINRVPSVIAPRFRQLLETPGG